MNSVGASAQGLRLERMRASPRWDGLGFVNRHPIAAGLRDPRAVPPTLGEFLFGGERRVPRQGLASVDPRALWARPPASGLRATWLGHSTVLLEIDGAAVLTDPVWGPRASPLRLLGPRRFQPVPVALAELPPLTAIVISHDHYDHLDYPTILELRRGDVPIVTSLGVGAHLQAWGVDPQRIVELDWWESWEAPRIGLRVTAAPAQHFSGRGLRDRNATLWSSMVMQTERHRVFFSGDTGLTTEYAAIAQRLGPFDLVLLEIGAFHPSWGHIHLGPEHALEAWRMLGGGALLPVHWGTFALGVHDWDQPIESIYLHAPALGVPLLLPRLGEALEPAHEHRLQPWWRAADAAPLPQGPRARALRLPKALPWPFD